VATEGGETTGMTPAFGSFGLGGTTGTGTGTGVIGISGRSVDGGWAVVVLGGEGAGAGGGTDEAIAPPPEARATPPRI